MSIRWTACAVEPHLLQEARRDAALRARLIEDALDLEQTGAPRLHLDQAWDGLWYLLSGARRRWLAAQRALVSREAERLRQAFPGYAGPLLIDAEAPGRWRVDAAGAAVAGRWALVADDDGGFARGLGRRGVAGVAAALARRRRGDLLGHFDPEAMDRLGVYPGRWREDGAEARDWMSEAFSSLKDFHATAARGGLAAVIVAG